MIGIILCACSSDNNVEIQENTSDVEREQTNTLDRKGSRTNVLQMGENVELAYSDWNTGNDGEIVLSAVSYNNGKATLNIELKNETKNNPLFLTENQADSLIVPVVQIFEVDDPMTFVWGECGDYLNAEEDTTISVGRSEDIVYDVDKQYIVIVTSVLQERDNRTDYDIVSGKYNCYYTFVQLY